jgi:hypothetical protein
MVPLATIASMFLQTKANDTDLKQLAHEVRTLAQKIDRISPTRRANAPDSPVVNEEYAVRDRIRGRAALDL